MSRRVLAVAAAALVLAGSIPGGPIGTAEAATGTTIELDAALDDQQRSEEVTFTVRATGNGTVTATEGRSAAGGDVDFAFEGWEDRNSGADGNDNTWRVQAGHEYEVTYEITAASGAPQGRVERAVGLQGPVTPDREQLYVDVRYRQPSFGDIENQDTQVVFEDPDEESASIEVSIPNVGAGVMKPTGISFRGTGGMDVTADGLGDTIAPGDRDEVTIDITVDGDVSQGVHGFTAVVEDNLGNTAQFGVRVRVIKPPAVEVDGPIDVGDVLVGSSKSVTFAVSETNGFTGIDGISADVRSHRPDADIAFSGLGGVRTGPNGQDSVGVTVRAADTASQHNELSWSVEFTPNHRYGVSDEFDVEARVIYPAYFGRVAMDDVTLVFDEPRAETETFRKRVQVTVPNDGDLTMDVRSVSATVGARGISAQVVRRPESIPGREEGTIAVRVAASSDVPEGQARLNVDIRARNGNGEPISTDVTRSVTIEHEIRLGVERTTLDYGEVVIAKDAPTRSTDIAELLGYEDVRGLTVSKASGPELWLEVVEAPSGTLEAGERASFVVDLEFDTGAEVFSRYTWEFRVDGDNVEQKVITVTARTKPFSFERIRKDLAEHEAGGGWQAEVAGNLNATMAQLERRLRADRNAPPGSDISTAFAAGKSAVLFIESVESARETIDSEGHDAAAADVLRAAAAYNSLRESVRRFEDRRLRSQANRAVDVARREATELIADQREYYRSSLDAPETTMRQRAQIKRQLAQLALLRGERERARTLRAEADQAFDKYIGLVREGNEHRRRANATLAAMKESTLVVVFDRWLLLNPAKIDRFESGEQTVMERYAAARETFRRAGAEQEAADVATRRATVADRLQFARYSLYAATGVYLLLFLAIIVHLVRGTYAYVRDARASVSGDFLL